MTDRSGLAVEIVDQLERNGGTHPDRRRAHARGLCYRAVFIPTGEAAALTTAKHLQAAPTPAIVRFSNASTDPGVPDARGPWGMAVKFHLPDATDTDIVSVSLSVFLASTPETFLELLRATAPDPGAGGPSRERIGAFLAAHPESAAGVAETAALQPPASYATLRYRALHAFTWVAAGGERRSVRYRWEPAAGVATLDAADVGGAAPHYLTEELTRRLAEGPVAFGLHVQVAGPGDPGDDPTRTWAGDPPGIGAGPPGDH